MEQLPVHWPRIEGRTVLLAVSGGIAAYKAAELCRLLRRCGASVRVMMTAAATRFVGPITFAALTEQPVATELFDPRQEAQIGHIGLADEAELLVAAPATANLLAKLAHGIADDLVSTVYLAFRGPVLLAPAMNVHMWQHPATRDNLVQLRQRPRHAVIGPDSGELACGHEGAGRLADPEQILQAAGACLVEQDLAGRRVLVSAGPTHESLDPVRYLGNRSSGKMGLAVAAEAASRGASTTLVAGPCQLPTPHGVTRVDVQSALEMERAVTDSARGADLVVMAAAVADYRPAESSRVKIKKQALGQRPALELSRNPDILAGLGGASPRPVLVGFAAETGGDLEQLAADKLRAKGCDLLVANDVAAADAGFEVDTNRVTLLGADGQVERLPLLSKRDVAAHLLDRARGLMG